MNTSAGKLRTPKSTTTPNAKGTFMERSISLKYTRIRPNTMEITIWSAIFCFTERPSLLLFFTFRKSSIKPTSPKPSVRNSTGRTSGSRMAKTRHETRSPARIIRPPIFGVPVLVRWLFGPSSRSVCCAFIRISAGIRNFPVIAEIANAISIGIVIFINTA